MDDIGNIFINTKTEAKNLKIFHNTFNLMKVLNSPKSHALNRSAIDCSNLFRKALQRIGLLLNVGICVCITIKYVTPAYSSRTA